MKKSLLILLIVIAGYATLCLTKHQYVRLTADSMLYFSIAQKYLTGDFQNAINGYWGPLLAWSLMPFLYLGASDVFTINSLNLMIGILTFIGAWKLAGRLEVADNIMGVLMICLLPIVLKFSLIQPMDFLLVCILIFYLGIVFKSDYQQQIHSGLICGILGSLAYFTKAYAFPFFIVHFFIMNILHYFKSTVKSDRKKVLRNAIAGFLLFFLISGAWIMAISDKYGHVTFSTMRDTNFNAPGPDDIGGGLEFGVPVFSEGFFAPPNETAFVIWEDPSYLRGKPWSAMKSWYYFKHFIRLVLKNVSEGLRILEGFSTLSTAIVISYILLLVAQPLNTWLHKGALLFPLFTFILFSGGYVMFHLEERYLWLSNVLLLVMGGYVLNVLLQKDFFNHTITKVILITFFVISFIFTPSKYVIQAGRGGMDSDMYYVSTDLTKHNIKGNIASNREYVPVHDAWHKTFRLTYWLDSRYFGQPPIGISDIDLQNELNKYNIDYYFFWGESNSFPQFLSQYNELTNNEIPGLKVFSLKDKK
ncbi:MAG: hypothetical protein HY757_06330 [Nitrospirae bacterium]|nr:hypothetical protein [Nitrospirota bacterium]